MGSGILGDGHERVAPLAHRKVTVSLYDTIYFIMINNKSFVHTDTWSELLRLMNTDYILSSGEARTRLGVSRDWMDRYIVHNVRHVYVDKIHRSLLSVHLDRPIRDGIHYNLGDFNELLKKSITFCTQQTVLVPGKIIMANCPDGNGVPGVPNARKRKDVDPITIPIPNFGIGSLRPLNTEKEKTGRSDEQVYRDFFNAGMILIEIGICGKNGKRSRKVFYINDEQFSGIPMADSRLVRADEWENLKDEWMKNIMNSLQMNRLNFSVFFRLVFERLDSPTEGNKEPIRSEL